MSQGPLASPPPGSPPPAKKSGARTIVIVIVVLLLLIAICCGTCLIGGPMIGLQLFDKAAGIMTEPVMARIRGNQEVKDRLGEPLTAGRPTSIQNRNGNVTIDFPVTGPKGTAQVQAELTDGPNGTEPTSIRVTPPDGATINVGTTVDPTDLNFPDLDVESEMESEPEEATDGSDTQ